MQAAEINLSRVTHFSFQILFQGMGDLWKEINKEIIDFIYNSATPDSSRIIAPLDELEEPPWPETMHLAPSLYSSLYTGRDNVVYAIEFRLYNLSSSWRD